MSKSTSGTQKTYKYHRKCLLHEIKKCNVIIHTNRINQKFCCDEHRYMWHNSMRALFRRVALVEKQNEKIIEILNDHIGMRIEQDGTIHYPVKEKMK